MTFSENTNNLFAALAKFQKECPNISKDGKVAVFKNGKKQYDFEYATYGNILRAVKPVLSDNELSVIQNVSEQGVQSIITHSSGQWMKTGFLPILLNKVVDGETVNAKEQEVGSSITYKKRYQLAALLLQDADLDEDGNAADGNEAQLQNKSQTNGSPAPKANNTSKPKAVTNGTSKPKEKPKEKKSNSSYEDVLLDAENGKIEHTDLIQAYQAELATVDDKTEFQKVYHQRTQTAIQKLMA